MTFLQGQFSADLRPIVRGEGSGVYGLWLTEKGKVLGDSVIWRDDREGGATEVFHIVSLNTAASTVRERLERFIIADDVTLEDLTPSCAALTVVGDAVEACIARDDESRLREFVVLPARVGGWWLPARRGMRALEWIGPADRAPAVEEPLRLAGVPEVSEDDLERVRIAAGVPHVPGDIGPEDLPQEGGLEREAVSFEKGCYLGQEIMARIHAMGQVRRRLVRVRGRGTACPAPGAALWQGGRQIGSMRSSVSAAADGDSWHGLAMVSLMHARWELPAGLALDDVPDVALFPPA